VQYVQFCEHNPPQSWDNRSLLRTWYHRYLRRYGVSIRVEGSCENIPSQVWSRSTALWPIRSVSGSSRTGIEFVRPAMLKSWGEEHFSNADSMLFVHPETRNSASTLDVSFVRVWHEVILHENTYRFIRITYWHSCHVPVEYISHVTWVEHDTFLGQTMVLKYSSTLEKQGGPITWEGMETGGFTTIWILFDVLSHPRTIPRSRTADFTILVVNPLNKKTFKVQGIVQIPENITSTVPLASSITMGLEIGLLYN